MEVAGPLGTPLGLAQRKRASPRGEAGTSGFLSVSDSDRRVPAELGQESQASSCLRTPCAARGAPPLPRSRGAAHLHQRLSVSPVPTPGSLRESERQAVAWEGVEALAGNGNEMWNENILDLRYSSATNSLRKFKQAT